MAQPPDYLRDRGLADDILSLQPPAAPSFRIDPVTGFVVVGDEPSGDAPISPPTDYGVRLIALKMASHLYGQNALPELMIASDAFYRFLTGQWTQKAQAGLKGRSGNEGVFTDD